MIQPRKEDTKALFNSQVERRKNKLIEFCQSAYADLKGRMTVMIEFMRITKREIVISKEVQKRLEVTQNITLLTEPLR